jgi:hypothetical protein
MTTPGQFHRLFLVIGLFLLSISFAVEFFAWAFTRSSAEDLSQAEQEIQGAANFALQEPMGSV